MARSPSLRHIWIAELKEEELIALVALENQLKEKAIEYEKIKATLKNEMSSVRKLISVIKNKAVGRARYKLVEGKTFGSRGERNIVSGKLWQQFKKKVKEDES